MQKTMLGPEVLDSEGHQEIVFKSTGAESVGEGRWAVHGNLTLRGQTRPITVQVTLKDGRYTGEATVKQTDFGIWSLSDYLPRADVAWAISKIRRLLANTSQK